MKRTIVPLLALVAAQSGCAPSIDAGAGGREIKEAEHVFYYDRNADGRVDRESHRFIGWADADWELLDEDFDGRFEKRIQHGVGVLESKVDIVVPKGVRIESAATDKK